MQDYIKLAVHGRYPRGFTLQAEPAEIGETIYLVRDHDHRRKPVEFVEGEATYTIAELNRLLYQEGDEDNPLTRHLEM